MEEAGGWETCFDGRQRSVGVLLCYGSATNSPSAVDGMMVRFLGVMVS